MRRIGRRVGAAVAQVIRDHDAEVEGQEGGDLVPPSEADVREAVEEEDGVGGGRGGREV